MAKRQINKQQAKRIQKIQDQYRQIGDDTTYISEQGLVITRFSKHAEIEDASGNRIHCAIRPNLDALVAGDRVAWQMSSDGKGVVVSRYPRDSVLQRADKRYDNKPVAANITQLIIVVAAKPELSWSLLDSYLVIAENLNLQATIVLNKIDLACSTIQQELINYRALGYPVLFTCKKNLQGYKLLEEVLNQHTSVFVGQSGVGKSSLISGVLPHETDIQIGDISSISELGRHTTSNSRFYHLPKGGALIDSPGVREFGLWRMPVSDIIYGFREFRSLVPLCKFRNCTHVNSPGCALIQAAQHNHAFQKRYDNLMKIIAQFQ